MSAVATAVIGIVCFLGARELTSGGVAAAQRQLTPTSEVEAMLDRQAASDPMTSAIAEYFPNEWSEMRLAMAEDIKSSISSVEIERRAHARSRQFMVENAAATAASPTTPLLAAAKAETLLISQLQQENEQYCADFAVRGLQAGTRPSETAINLVGQAARARVIATRQGLDSPTRRAAPSDEDWGAVLDEMTRRGATEAMFNSLSDSSAASPQLQCSGGVIMYQAITSLPAEQGARVYAEVAKEAAKL